MTTYLQSENVSLRQQLESLLREARLNEGKMRRFDQLERQLIGAGCLTEFVRLLLTEYKLAFGVEFVTLVLVDPQYEATRILQAALDDDEIGSGLMLLPSPTMLEALYDQSPSPRLGPFNALRHQALFKSSCGAIASVALLPLSRQGELIGSLNFGSANPDRYVADYGTEFLERLAEIIAVCLQSALTQERLKMVGLTDGLTGVQNRRYFEHRLLEEVSLSRRHKHPLACMFLDIDKFKRINDIYGHQTGDEVLRSVAGVIASQLRMGDTISRYGGEEFVVLLPQASGHHALEIAERIRLTIAEQCLQAGSGEEINVTISIGLSMLASDESAADLNQLGVRLVSDADKALYQAKHGGRNRVICDAGLRLGVEQSMHGAGNVQLFVSGLCSRLQGLPEQAIGLLKQLAGRAHPSRSRAL